MWCGREAKSQTSESTAHGITTGYHEWMNRHFNPNRLTQLVISELDINSITVEATLAVTHAARKGIDTPKLKNTSSIRPGGT